MFTAYDTLKGIAKLYSALFARAEVHGQFRLLTGPKIIAANHTLASDAIQIPLVLEEPLTFLVQADLFTFPLLGKLLRASGQIPVDHDGDKPCIAMKTACRLLREGKSIVIFPEGKLVPPGERASAQTGVIRMALYAGIPIIPLGIYVAPENITALSIRRLGKKRTGLWQTSGTCHLNFGASWMPRALDHNKEHLRELADQLMHKIYTLVSETEKETLCASPALLNATPQA